MIATNTPENAPVLVVSTDKCPETGIDIDHAASAHAADCDCAKFLGPDTPTAAGSRAGHRAEERR